jgi:type IV secretory pathway VirB2 component (pilin)
MTSFLGVLAAILGPFAAILVLGIITACLNAWEGSSHDPEEDR